MSLMAKLNLKSVERVAPEDPVQARRGKLVAALDEQHSWFYLPAQFSNPAKVYPGL